MKNKKMKKQEINKIAELKDKTLENEFFNQYIDRSKLFIQVSALLGGLLFLLLMFFDVFVVHSEHVIFDVLARVFVFLCAIGVTLIARKSKNARVISDSYLMLLIILVVVYQIILVVNNDTTVMDRAFAFLVIIVALFLIPTRWIYSVLFAIGTVGMFTACSIIFFEPGLDYQLPGIIVYFLVTILLAGLYSFNLNASRRMYFVKTKELEVLSSTDILTNAYNRQAADKRIKDLLVLNENSEPQFFSLIMFDLDDFKHINDTYGHQTGDKVLKVCAKAAQEGLRKGDVFSRWGGEEFIIVLPGASIKQAVDVAERLRSSIKHCFDAEEYNVTASFGVTEFFPEDTFNSIMGRVDENMYQAKIQGKNQVIVN